MNTTTPIISIILPVFNKEKLLARAIESVIQQTISDWELIIVNDGSGDSSIEVAKKYLKKTPQIICLDLKHAGVSNAINSGFNSSHGSYITTLGADDFYKPNHLEDNLNSLKHHPEIDLIMSKAEIIGSPYVMDIELPGKLIHLDRCALGGTFFVKREVFSAVGGRPLIQFGTDYYFAQKVSQAGYNVRKYDTRTYVYDRTSDNSITKLEENRFILKKTTISV